jgi:hypothetical protein
VADTKQKGSIALTQVIADLVERGGKVFIPIDEDCLYDLIVDYQARLVRVQVKFTQSDGAVIKAKAMSSNSWVSIKYTATDIDVLAIWDNTSRKIYYLPSQLLGNGRAVMALRLTGPKNNQAKNIRWAEEFIDFEAAISSGASLNARVP